MGLTPERNEMSNAVVPNVCPHCGTVLTVRISKPEWPHMFAYLILTCAPCQFEHIEALAGGT